MNLALPCLSIAIGFSWLGCLSTFATNIDSSRLRINLASAAAAVCISAIGLAFVHQDFILGALACVAGLAIAYTIGMALRPTQSFLISAIGLSVYLQGISS